ncbi:hypothetical protein [Soonwooa sp.]|uniref:hypothetical protein n=1 Tax=Soonwooa sp. TaxID=1938592 RepID=UPI0028AE0FA3|nr:hypothetical protein [Soonwooa sp.]
MFTNPSHDGSDILWVGARRRSAAEPSERQAQRYSGQRDKAPKKTIASYPKNSSSPLYPKLLTV